MEIADRLVLYDTAQYSKNDFHNRNRIKTPVGPQWITVPVKSPTLRPIRDIRIDRSQAWNVRIWKTISANYAGAPHFDTYEKGFRNLLLDSSWERLAVLNEELIRLVSELLDLGTEIIRASALGVLSAQDATGKLVELTHLAGGNIYLSGPDGPSYLETSKFRDLELSIMPRLKVEYPQLWGSFTPDLSVIDAIFNIGDGARSLLTSIDARER